MDVSVTKMSKRGSLSDKIAGILNAAPSFDPEDDAIDATSAKVIEGGLEDELEEQILSKFRKQNLDLLSDVDKKYAGKKVTRKTLKESDEDYEDDSIEGPSESEDEQSSEAEESDNIDSEGVSETGKLEQGSEDSNEDEESGSEEGEETDNDDASEDFSGSEGDDVSIGEDREKNFKHMSESSASSLVQKGSCVRNQMTTWESLLEMRIQLQKCLIAANKMPQKENFTQIKQESGSPFSNSVSKTVNTVSTVLDNLLLLQSLVLKKYPETKALQKEKPETSKDSHDGDEDDEEIPSDSDAEHSEDAEIAEEPQRKRRRLMDYSNDISQRHKKYTAYRNKTIQKWNDKTRIAAMKSGVAAHSVLNQIEYNLSSKDKLVKRTQLKRSPYDIVGQENTESEQKSGEEHNTEIFDDDDFYHQLLRELIEVKSADITDPVQLGRQWIQLHNMRSKMKRKIDTKATKGRKIRYAVHTKLVNFMAPIEREQWAAPDEAKTELYSSLFGKRV